MSTDPTELDHCRPGYTIARTAAYYAGVTPNNITRLCRSGSLISYRAGRRRYISLASLAAWITAHPHAGAHPEALADLPPIANV